MTTVQANRGATIPDTVAVGESNELQSEWLAKQRINTQDRIQLKNLSHMRYQHPDLDEIERFRIDFRMRVAIKSETGVWCKGCGPDQYVYYARRGPKQFLGGTFEAQSQNRGACNCPAIV